MSNIFLYLRKKFLVTLTLLGTCMCFQAMSQTEKELVKNFDGYRQNKLQEKLFVHTDKNSYLAGEICWFKIYDVDASFHQLLNMSRVAYAEVLDGNNKPILQAKIELKDGQGNGSFFLPASTATGNYKFRAYSNWMKNDGATWYFEKELSIINPDKGDWKNTGPVTAAYEINFFPEGGNLATEAESRIAFKVSDQFGRGVNCSGIIVNDKGDTIKAFQTYKFGMGNFLLTPHHGVKYKAIIQLPSKTIEHSLLDAIDAGYAMRIKKEAGNKISVTITSPGSSNSSLFLFVHTRNVTSEAKVATMKDEEAVFSIDENKLDDGISHFTVFNQNGQPLCERLFFKRPQKKLTINLAADAASYSKRKKVTVNVTSTNEKLNSLAGDFSMAVYRVDSTQELSDASITSYLLLKSDLAGYIESPGFYFNNTDSADIAVDNLLMTQGWRRFKWQDLIQRNKSEIKYLPEIYGHIISGKIINQKNSGSAEQMQAYISAPGTYTQFKSVTSDGMGNVKFDMPDFYTNGELIAQTNYTVDSSYRIDIESPFSTDYSSNKIAPLSISASQENLLSQYLSKQVQHVYLSNKVNKLLMPSIDSTAFYSKANETFLLDNYVRFATVEEVLREYVPSVLVKRSGTKFSLPIVDVPTRTLLPGAPLLLIDGVPIFNFDKFMMYDALKYRKLEVIAEKYIAGKSVYNGILNFSSYKGDIGGFELDPHATVIDYEGLQLKREFYSPSYETNEQALSRLPDFRNLLYWSPGVSTGKDGKASVSFYSSDLPGKYVVIIQGIGEGGRTGSSSTYFTVVKP